MPKCRPGSYPTNGSKIIGLRERCPFPTIDAFCEAAVISKPTLRRAEAGGCCYSASLVKIADKLGLPSWKELLALTIERPDRAVDPFTGDIPGMPGTFPTHALPPTLFRDIVINEPFSGFDETIDTARIFEQIEALVQHKIPFIVLGFFPRNSLAIRVALLPPDAAELDFLYRTQQLRVFHIEAVEAVSIRGWSDRELAVRLYYMLQYFMRMSDSDLPDSTV